MKTHHWLIALPLLLGSSCSLQPDPPDGSGTIECTQVRVACEVSGRIASLLFEEGDAVTNGQTLALLDPLPYTLRREEARAALAQAQAQFELMAAGSRSEDILKARAQVANALALAEVTASDARRMETVFAQNSVSQKQRDDAVAAAKRAAAELAAAEQQLNRQVSGNRQEEIRSAGAAVDVARARLALTEKAVADCVVAAPLAGVITTRSAEPGEVVAVGAPLATLAQLDKVWLSLYIPEHRLAAVKIGQGAFVKIDGESKRHEGRVTFVSPEAEFTPRNIQTPDERTKLVYRIKVTLSNPDGRLKPGMPADGYLGK
jgi:HlyD family secretion protein